MALSMRTTQLKRR